MTSPLSYGPFISKADAKAAGLQRYRTGKPCKYGHDTERYTATGICVGCTRARKSYNRKTDAIIYGPFLSQSQAKERGIRHFYNGDACRNGHVAAKYSNGSGCVECAINRAKGWKSDNRSKVLVGGRKYNATKRDTRREMLARESDPQRRAVVRLRVLLKNTLKGGGGRKAAKTEELLGCSVADACAHIAAQFLPGMSWENHGKWHIDHIRPCASFDDLNDPAQQRECCHFSNLQPLWAADNIAKSDTWEPVAA